MPSYHANERNGTTMVELIVSFSLLATIIAVVVPLTVRHGRILASARHYRIALDELSNQAERLSALPLENVADSIGAIEASQFAQERLPNAELSAQLSEPNDAGMRRAKLSIIWDEPGRRDHPLSLAIWLAPQSTAEHATESDSPNEESP
jgi:hypothetical protein